MKFAIQIIYSKLMVCKRLRLNWTTSVRMYAESDVLRHSNVSKCVCVIK